MQYILFHNNAIYYYIFISFIFIFQFFQSLFYIKTFFRWAGILDGQMGQEALKKHLLSTAAQARRNVRGCDVLILDEISMISAKVFDSYPCSIILEET